MQKAKMLLESQKFVPFEDDHQVPDSVEVEAFAGRDDCSGAVFGDDGGAGTGFAGFQRVARADCGCVFPGVEPDWGVGRGGRAELCSAWTGKSARPHMSKTPA